MISARNRSPSYQELCQSIESMAALNVLVIGETIVDEYAYCEVNGKSGKEPTLVGEFSHIDLQAGGVLAIANHLVDFCGTVQLLSGLGELESREAFVRSSLRIGVQPQFASVANATTIVKRRYLDAYSKIKLLGVYKSKHAPPTPLGAWHEQIREAAAQADLVLVADYGHGLISPECAQIIAESSRYLGINCQMNSSNLGYHVVSKYPRADFVCIHEGELRLDARDQRGPIEDLMARAQEKLACDNILVTQGRRGTLLRSQDGSFYPSPALANKVIERVGAGDAVLALAGLGSAAKIPPEDLGILANLAGARLVGSMGNSRCVRKESLLNMAQSVLDSGVDSPALKQRSAS